MKRDCMFYVADLNMAETFRGFLTRDQFHQSLGCAKFVFDTTIDIRHAGGIADSLHTQAGPILRGYQTSYKKLVVAQDCQFDGSPGRVQIKKNLTDQLRSVGWIDDDFLVIAIEPELEQWIWQDSSHVEAALNYKSPPTLRQFLLSQNLWPANSSKPINPKETLEAVAKQNGVRRSGSVYGRISSKVSVKSCADPEFMSLVQRLRTWFPVGAAV